MFGSSRLCSSIGGPFGLHFETLLASRWLQPDVRSSQDGSETAWGASKTPLKRLQGRPRARPRRPHGSPRVQDGSGSLQGASKSSSEESLETPSRLQELSRGAFQASGSWPAASSLFAAAEVYGPAGGLGGMREALTILRNAKQLLRTLKDSEFIRTTPKGSPSWGSWVLCKQSVEELSTRPATAVHTSTS